MKNGLFVLTFIVIFALGNISATSPEITLIGNNSANVEIGTNYTDEGATLNNLIPINDNTKIVISFGVDLVLNFTVTKTSDVDTSKPGTYAVIYNVLDSEGNIVKTATRTVNVVDTTPVIAINEDNSTNVELENNSISVTNNPSQSDNSPTQTETASSTGITGKSTADIILGENKGARILAVVLIIAIIAGYMLIKRQIRKKLYGK